MEDGAGQISAPGGTDLHEAGSIDEHKIPDICNDNSHGVRVDTVNSHRHTAMIQDVILPLIGIVLIAFIMVAWL